MQVLCPNCKQSADIITIDGVDYIECPDCQWFKVEGDGTMTVCDEPTSKVDRPPEPGQIEEPAKSLSADVVSPASTAKGDDEPVTDPETEPAVNAASSPGQPGIEEDDEDEDEDDEINVNVTFED